MDNFSGIIVDRSLQNPQYIHTLNIMGKRQAGSWGMYLVSIPEMNLVQQIIELQQNMIKIEEDCWYAHFFRGEELIVVYQDRTFHVSTNPETWEEAVSYGLTHGIPMVQLDFTPRTKFDAEAYFEV